MHKETSVVGALLTLYVVSVIVNLGVLEFSGEEPRRAMISIEMLSSGNFIRPTQYGWDYYNKPPFFNWMQAAVISITGSASECVLRLPSLFFYLLMAFVHYKISKQFFPRQIALLSAFFVLTCGDVYTYGLAYGGEIDIFYSFIVFMQVISIFWFYQMRQYGRLFLVSYLFCAIGFLTKAFPSIVFQGLTLAALCVYARSIKVLLRRQHLAGLLVFLLVVGGYFTLYNHYSSSSRFLLNLLNESVAKSGIGERAHKLLDKSIIYPWLFWKMFAPWSLLLFLLVKRIRYGFKDNPLVWFSMLFILFNLGVYWFTGQPKIRYVYMFIPFGCIILTHIYHQFLKIYFHLFNQVLRYFGIIFLFPLATVLLFPFYRDAPIGWIAILTLMFLTLIFYYFRLEALRIWLFLTGFMLLRLVYAVLFVPLQRQGIESYNNHTLKVAQATGKDKVEYLSAASLFPVAIVTPFFNYQLETILKPDVLPLELPYYYYRNTGFIIRFDTVQTNDTKYFISFLDQVNNKQIDTIYKYFDRNLNREVIFYRFKK